ncbi:MAG TPA: glycosyl hydrolase family 28-related protein [Solimonas sp.]|nr:glycosyl hydrolase family 28-related protein [Solimonas sp.]
MSAVRLLAVLLASWFLLQSMAAFAAPRLTLNVRNYGALGNGISDDAAAIQAALDAVPASGGNVYFPAGRYLVHSTLFPRSNTAVLGESAASTTLKGGDIFRAVLDVSAREQITIRHLTLTFDATTYDTDGSAPLIRAYSDVAGTPTVGISVRDCILRDTTKQALTARGTDRSNGPVSWRLLDNRFERTGRGSAVFFNGEDIVVERNIFVDSGDDAIAFIHATNNSVARRNHITRAGALLGHGSGIKLHGRDNWIRDNTVVSAVNGGIHIKQANVAGVAPPSGNIIVNNKLLGLIDGPPGSSQAGIQILDSAGTTVVTGNRLFASSPTRNYDGIRIENSSNADVILNNNIIAGNLSYAAGMPAVRLTSAIQLLEITGNSISTTSDTFILSTTSREGRIGISGNRIDGAGSKSIVRMPQASAGVPLLQTIENQVVNHSGPFFNTPLLGVTTLRTVGNVTNSAQGPLSGLKSLLGVITLPVNARSGSLALVPGQLQAEVTFESLMPDDDYNVTYSVRESGGGSGTWGWTMPGTKRREGFSIQVSNSAAASERILVDWRVTH